MSIFISHSSNDQYIIQQFVDKILKLGCGLNNQDIFCTSVEGIGIRKGEDFRERIKSQLQNAKYSFIMISENYKRSEVCLNEMGASWGIDKINVRQYLFPNLGFNSLGLLLNTQQGAKLNSSVDLDELHQELSSAYNRSTPLAVWNQHKIDFLNILDAYSKDSSNHIFPSPYDYFSSFVQENASLNHLLLKAHPTLLDCKRIFSTNYYRHFFEFYSRKYEEIEKEYMEPLYPEKQHFRITKSDVSTLQNGMPGGMVQLAEKGCFNYGVDFYRVQFLSDRNSDLGLSYTAFCFVNNRWVFIPKPWRSNV